MIINASQKMSLFGILASVLVTFAASSYASANSKFSTSEDSTLSDVQTVPFVDLERYLGKWYEVASIPQSFQRDCIKNTTAEYSVEPETGYIVVLNSCDQEDGSRKDAEGRARIENEETQAELKVTFVKIFDWVFRFGGDYWVIGLQKDYQWAVVGHPTREYAWILARKPNLSKRSLKAAHDVLIKNGYDTCTLMVSIQDGGRQVSQPLCELFN